MPQALELPPFRPLGARDQSTWMGFGVPRETEGRIAGAGSLPKHRFLRLGAVRGDLVGYLHGSVGKEGAEILSANTVDDHVHLLLGMKPAPAPSDLVRKIKTNSSRWIHGRYPDVRGFAWRSGFGIFHGSAPVTGRSASWDRPEASDRPPDGRATGWRARDCRGSLGTPGSGRRSGRSRRPPQCNGPRRCVAPVALPACTVVNSSAAR
ncbi:MAG: hypothetical protein HN341_15650 [Verrucomicrobia bacterium]|nr:hypothetical protein [Verrucomicrobiota bacterium]